MTGRRKRRQTIVIVVCVVAVGLIAAAWWSTTLTYSRTATITITSTDPTQDADRPGADIPTLRFTALSLDGYDPLPQVSDRLAEQRGGSASDYLDTVSITPTDPETNTAGLIVTAEAGSADEAVDLANQAADIAAEQFNAVPAQPAGVIFRADVTEPAR
ncbi:hypothetical protein [Rhodococcus sp. SORGH_AS_0301]|uniref:hypothetical protein n=1 Tax=Rhodococcus sp. SORGH_AS_0301 TaxID=3041780 RepID=UPI0027869505|nr:hypothetical protein [Rhodococcus sp. SORGH_AS_0301]MDQ1178670.1 capsular polysaccharide biosynthesis protein [Rhodococcus sp. SORGH_AS_0301]